MIKETLIGISENFLNLADSCENEIKFAYEIIIKSIKSNGKIIFCGNGGSAADSQHLAAELIGRYRKDRNPIPAISLSTDTSIITAISNDYNFSEVFTRQLDVIGNKNDILYAISTSGKSINVLKAMKLAKTKKMKVIGITGIDGKEMKKDSDVLIKVPSSRSDRIQEMHIAIGQILCELIENELYN